MLSMTSITSSYATGLPCKIAPKMCILSPRIFLARFKKFGSEVYRRLGIVAGLQKNDEFGLNFVLIKDYLIKKFWPPRKWPV